MELFVINSGNFKLDGGAMFGVVPKSIWNRTNPADENNMISIAARNLLVKNGDRTVLIDNGMGEKQSEKFFSYYSMHGDDNLLKSLHAAGTGPEDITDMFLTHLHFDHCGGGVKRKNDTLELTFKNAKYWSNKQHWQWATHPNDREKASFLKENILPMEESGHLHFLENENFEDLFDVHLVDGHSEKQMLPKIQYKGHTIVYVADLIPTAGHIPLPYIMGYDTRPLLTLKEKASFLQEAADKKYILFFEHDPVHECCTVKHTDRGVRVNEFMNLSEL